MTPQLLYFHVKIDNLQRISAEQKFNLIYKGGSLRLIRYVSIAAHVG